MPDGVEMIMSASDFLPEKKIRHRVFGLDAEKEVEIGEAEIGIHHKDFLFLARERRGQIDNGVGLADPAFAACHSENPRRGQSG